VTGPYTWHVCPSGVPGITTEPRHFETWERLPEALRQDLVNAIVEEDHNVELDGWPSHKAVRRTAARDRAACRRTSSPTSSASIATPSASATSASR
jgi:hypothetical protein